MSNQQITKKPKHLLLWALVLLVIVGLGFGIWRSIQAGLLPFGSSAKSTATAGSTYKTTAVRKGDLAVSISGSGEVVTLTTINLGFSTSGTIDKINVQVGDSVTEGEVLATLSNIDQLKLDIQKQQVAVQTAQKVLDDLQANSAATLAQAEYDQAAAEEALVTAKANLHTQADGRCSGDMTEQYYEQYVKVKSYVDTWEGYLKGGTGYSQTYILQRLTPMRKEMEQAYANWQYCQGYTDQEILDSQAAYQLAQANLEKAQATYANLKANSGIDPTTLKIDQAKLKDAQSQLIKLQQELDGTTIVAPFSGVVTAINASIGDEVGNSSATKTEPTAIITLSDMSNPKVQVNIDETDLENIAVGCDATVTFDSLTGQTFSGLVTQVEPSLVSVQNVSMVQGQVDLTKKQTASGKNLPLGLTGTVEISCQQANGVLLIPAQALYQKNGASYVYVLNAQGQPEKRTVEVGLKTVALAEIRSGLSLGEKVITSTVESSK